MKRLALATVALLAAAGGTDAMPDSGELSSESASESRPGASQNVCERTPQVRDQIVQVTGVARCDAVTERHLASISALDLGWQAVAALHEGDFAGLTSLGSLDLGENDLTALPKGTFAGLSNLESLDLYGNNLTALPDGTFAGLAALVSLDLRGNDLTTLPNGTFAGLSNLESLYLAANDLTALPEGVFGGLPSLQSLDLAGNDLTKLPERAFAGLAGLQSLSLSGNNLNTLPDGVFGALANLRSLNLAANDLTALPDGVFTALSSLQSLRLSDNDLRTLPEEVFAGLSGLQSLDVDDNPGSPFEALRRSDSWCTAQQAVYINFQRNGKTVSICEDEGVLTYFFGYLDAEPELRYSGRVLASIDATSAVVGGRDSEVPTEDLARLGDWNTDRETSDLLRELADAPTTGGFVVLHGLTGFTSSVRYIFRNGGWQYEISAVWGRTFNVPEGSEEYEYWANAEEYDITVRPPDGAGN